MYKFKKGDQVRIISGKDKGKTGKIEKVLQKENKLIVSGVNIYKRHRKVTRTKPAGIYDLTRPIPASKAMIICPKCNMVTRVGVVIEGKTRSRICKKCKGRI